MRNPSSSEVQGYSVAANGSVAPVPGSPFTVPLSSSLGVAGNDLFSANGSQGEIQAYAIASDGSLTQSAVTTATNYPAGSSSEGPAVLSFDTTGQTLYDLFFNNDAYQSFSIASGGALNFLGFTNGSSAEADSELSFTTNDRYAYDSSCFRGTPSIAGYTRSSNGLLTNTYDPQQPPQPTNAMGVYCPFGAAVAGDGYVVIAEQPTNDITPIGPYQLVVFNINNSDGSLSTTNTSSSATMANVGTQVNDYRFDPTHMYLAVAGTSGVNIFRFANGILTPMGTFPIAGGANALRWDDSGHLFAVGGPYGTPGYLYVFNMVGGMLTPGPGSPVALPANGPLAVKILQ